MSSFVRREATNPRLTVPSASLRRRPAGVIFVALLFLLLWGNAWVQVVMQLRSTRPDPPLLTVLQTASGALALAAALGAWRLRTWAAPSALAYGVLTGAMITALGPILALDADERAGLIPGGASVLLISVALAWYLHRATGHARRD
jgi:peptidoglycan/LPS O-acetylase OafA/YrhL